MFAVLILLFMAAVFGLCFLTDRLLRKKFPRKTGKLVCPPHRSLTFGILLIFIGVAAPLFLWAKFSWALRICCGLVAVMGAFLLLQYFSFRIVYDETGFYYRETLGAFRRAEYGDIVSQRSYLTRAGVNTTIYLKDGELHLYEALDGVRSFLPVAFDGWCRATGTDPASVPGNREMLTWFPTA